ncbi:hypothetical protein [Geopseudomonas aromaticivorans]
MQQGKTGLFTARTLLLATCISSAALLAGCSEDKAEAPQQKPAAAAPQPSAVDAEKAKREAEAAAKAKAAAEAAAPKVTVLPNPGPAPEGTQFFEIDQGNNAVFVSEALRNGPLDLPVLKRSLTSTYGQDPELDKLRKDVNSNDRFVARDANAAFDAGIGAFVEKYKGITYVRVDVADQPGLTVLKPYDFDKLGFPVDASTLLAGGDERGWLTPAENHRLLFKNGQDIAFFPIPDEKVARELEARVRKSFNGGLKLVVYGYIHSYIEAPADASYAQPWRGLDIQAQRVDLVDAKDEKRVFATLNL